MVKNVIFHCLVEEVKQEKQKIGEKVFPPRSTSFILPNWEENEKRKVLRNAFYTNTLSPTPHFISYILCNKGIIVNIYKLHFPSFHFSLQLNKRVFHTSNQTHRKENQIFSILSFFHHFTIFHPPTFPLFQPNGPLI